MNKQTRCDRCRRVENGRLAAYFVEYQVLVLDDPGYVVEIGGVVYGWWGPCCTECLGPVLTTAQELRLRVAARLVGGQAVVLDDGSQGGIILSPGFGLARSDGGGCTRAG